MTIMETNESVRINQSLPPAGEHVLVRCPKFSCLGYRDKDGTWKNVFTDQPLPDVVDFSEIG